MNNEAQKFIDCLDDAAHLLDDYPAKQFQVANAKLEYTTPEQFDLALFEQWSELCAPQAQQKRPVRIIQHLSCTGGTLLAKCLAAMPNVSLLSEVNPFSPMDDVHRSGFAPTDLTYLAKQISFPLMDDLSQKLFMAEIGVISEHAQQLGRYLVLREHSHSNFHVDTPVNEVSNIRTILGSDYALLGIITVRHPVDSYLSMMSNGWISFAPATFDEYCRRYLQFMDSNENVPVFKYEMFVDDAPAQMKLICEALALPFNEDFLDVFDLSTLSGDSGRASNIIGRRSRRVYDKKFRKEAKKSALYLELCERLDYDPSLKSPARADHQETDDPV